MYEGFNAFEKMYKGFDCKKVPTPLSLGLRGENGEKSFDYKKPLKLTRDAFDFQSFLVQPISKNL